MKTDEGARCSRKNTGDDAHKDSRTECVEKDLGDIEVGMRTISIIEDRDWISEPNQDATNKQEAKCKGMAKKGKRSVSSKKEDENLQQIIWEEVAKEHGMGGPCTECGITTSNWCDGGARKGNDCIVGSYTALCTNCDHSYGKCH